MPKLLSILLIALFVALGGCSEDKKKRKKKASSGDETEVPLLKRTGENDEEEATDDEAPDEETQDEEANEEANDGASLTDQANALADTICACKAKDCLKGLREKGSALEKEARDGSDADREGVAAAKQRAKACIRNMTEESDSGSDDDGPSISQRADKLATEMCACKDMDCVKGLIEQGKALERAAEAGSEADQSAFAAAKRRAKECTRTLRKSLRDGEAADEAPPAAADEAPAAGADAGNDDCSGPNAQKCFLESLEYQMGTGGKTKDFNRAMSLASQSCDGGDARGCTVAAGLCYRIGDNYKVENPKAKAAAFFAKACKLGQEAACKSAKALGASVD